MYLLVDAERCSGCGQCVDECPFDAIEMMDGVATVGDGCVQCMACLAACAMGALVAAPRAPAAGAGCGQVAALLDRERPEREQHTQQAAARLKAALDAAGIDADLALRVKSPCSTRDKMLRQHLGLQDLHDVCGIRVLVEQVADCYRTLEIVHRLWPHLPEAFDDYIAGPKQNGYQSLHTAVRLPCGHPLELQIRTHEQHRIAETGSAAHWRYKQAARPLRTTGGHHATRDHRR